MPQTELIQAMRDPSFYPQKADEVQFIQTHISCLFLVADAVYKLKKPLNLGFLDFSTLSKRRFYCYEELRLNSRLAPSVYVQVLPLCRDAHGTFHLGEVPEAEIVDYVVHMRRLSEQAMFPVLLKKGQVDQKLLQELARLLSDFHAQAQPVGDESWLGSARLVRQNLEENFEQTRMLIGQAFSARKHRVLRHALLWSLDRHHQLITSRHSRGKTRECHGDLRMEHICRFQGRLIAFDCIEFNERFRYIDICADLAFLLMDMEFHGYDQQAAILLQAYIQVSQDQEMPTLINVYKAYYALTRGKVYGIESLEEEFSADEKKQALEMCTALVDLAWSYAVKLQTPTLIVLCGLMGTGKSVVGRGLSLNLGAEMVRSDVVRKSLHGLDQDSKQLEEYGQGLYSEKNTEATYQALLDRAETMLIANQSVILDASFSRSRDRARALQLAHHQGARYLVLECVCPDEVIKERLHKRQYEQQDASNGRWSLFHKQKAAFEPVTDLGAAFHLRLDTTGYPDQVLEMAVEHVLSTLRAQEEAAGQ